MKNTQLKIVAGILSLAFVAVTAPVKAAVEPVSQAAQASLPKAAASILDSVKKWVKEQKRRIKQNETVRQCPEGTHPSQEGEMGTVCRFDNPASVSCEIVGYGPVTGEDGYRQPIVGKCTPEGGWAGSNPNPNAPQAP